LYTCNKCSAEQPLGTMMRSCHTGSCDYDLCQSCFDGSIQTREDDAVVDEEGCEREWPRFRCMMIRGIQDKQFSDLTSFLQWFLGGTFPGANLFPHLSLLLTIVCVLPVGSCSNERSFSRMKCAKTRLRNALGEDSLESEID
jgi:hypothetical protein